MRIWILTFIMMLLGAGTAAAQSASEASCNAGKAEACFYTAAEYAQGKGVPADLLKAEGFFLKACDMGVPDGCMYAGNARRDGKGNVPKDAARAFTYHERACRMGHVETCDMIYNDMFRVEGTAYTHSPKLLTILEAGCLKGDLVSCERVGAIFYNGRNNAYPGHVDYRRGAPLAGKACVADTTKIHSCYAAEDMYANPTSPAFDAAQALRFTKINCDGGLAGSCSNLGGVYYSIEDWPLALAAYEQACTLQPGIKACESIGPIRTHLAKVAEYEAIEAERKQVVGGLITQGKYGEAVNVAIHHYRAPRYVEQAVRAANSAGAMSSVQTQDLYVVAHWYDSGPIREIADREMRRRGTGLEGTFGTGTNNAGQADARYRQQYGSNLPRASASSSAPNSPSVLSSSDAAAQTREKYRYAHCTMNNNANRNVCR